MDRTTLSRTHWTNRLNELTPRPAVARTLWLATAVLISLLHLFTNTLGISHSDMTLDDAGTWGIANRSLATQLTLPTEFHSQPPLYYLLLHFLLYFGSSPWFLRSISWLFCWLLLLFVLFCWDELDLLARVGFCLIFLSSGITQYLATCVRPYGMAAFLTLVACVSFLRFANDPSRRRAVVYAVWTTAMLYTMAFEVAVFLVQGLLVAALVAVSVVRYPRAEVVRRSRRWLLTMLAVSVAYLPYLLLAYHYQYRANPKDTLAGILHLETYTKTLHWQFAFSTEMYAGLAALAGFALVGELCRGNWLVVYWPLMAVGSISFVWYFIIGRSILGAQSKYMIPAFLGVCALSALGLGQVRPLVRRGFWPVVVGLLAILVCTKFPAFSKFMRAGPDLGTFAILHRELKTFPGKKVFFPDVGYDGQRPEYVTRDDPDIIYATRRGRGWASAGEGTLTDEYVVSTIERWHSECPCFFYYLFFPDGPYARVFVPTLTKLGYRPTRALPITSGRPVIGYCRE